jgi:hypothetical protein
VTSNNAELGNLKVLVSVMVVSNPKKKILVKSSILLVGSAVALSMI